MPLKVVIIGGGGQGLIVADALLRARESGAEITPVGVVDDDPARHGDTVLGLSVLGRIADLSAIAHDAVVVAIGNNRTRRVLSERLSASGEKLVGARHPWTCVAPDVSPGVGSMLSAAWSSPPVRVLVAACC